MSSRNPFEPFTKYPPDIEEANAAIASDREFHHQSELSAAERIYELERECDSLRAELDKDPGYTKAEKERDQLRAENVRLKIEVGRNAIEKLNDDKELQIRILENRPVLAEIEAEELKAQLAEAQAVIARIQEQQEGEPYSAHILVDDYLAKHKEKK